MPGWLDSNTNYDEFDSGGVTVETYMMWYIWRCGVAILRVLDTPGTREKAMLLHNNGILHVYQLIRALVHRGKGQPPLVDLQPFQLFPLHMAYWLVVALKGYHRMKGANVGDAVSTIKGDVVPVEQTPHDDLERDSNDRLGEQWHRLNGRTTRPKTKIQRSPYRHR